MVKHSLFGGWQKLMVVYLFIAFGFSITKTNAQCIEKNTVFSAGEEVYYDAFYNWRFIWLNAGVVSFTVNNATWRNQPAYHIKSIGVTHSGYDRFYKVRDTFEVYMSAANLKPLEFRQMSNEGSYTANHHYIFNESNRTITANISREGKPFERSVLPWPECAFDVLSMIYQARNIEFFKYKKGDKIPISMVIDGEIHRLYIRYLGKENASTRDGREFRCLKFSPLLVKGTLFEAGEDMTVWVTDDKNRVPIVVEAQVLVGSVKAIYTGSKGLRHPTTSEIISK